MIALFYSYYSTLFVQYTVSVHVSGGTVAARDIYNAYSSNDNR